MSIRTEETSTRGNDITHLLEEADHSRQELIRQLETMEPVLDNLDNEGNIDEIGDIDEIGNIDEIGDIDGISETDIDEMQESLLPLGASPDVEERKSPLMTRSFLQWFAQKTLKRTPLENEVEMREMPTSKRPLELSYIPPRRSPRPHHHPRPHPHPGYPYDRLWTSDPNDHVDEIPYEHYVESGQTPVETPAKRRCQVLQRWFQCCSACFVAAFLSATMCCIFRK